MIKSLQAGRGLAALMVAGFHLGGACALIPAMRDSIVARSFHNCNVGVDFFFVLSGFIIMLAHERDIGRPGRLIHYLKKRFFRLYPVYWLYTLAFVTVVSFGYSAIALPRSPLDWLSVLTLVRFVSPTLPLNVSWTLFYEVAFYATFATLIVNRRAGLIAFAGWFALLVLTNLHTPQVATASVWLSRLSFNFFIGMAAYLVHSRLSRNAAIVTVFVGFLTIIVALVTADHGLSRDLFRSLIALASGAAITGTAALERRSEWKIGPLAGLGNASYTFYLVHVHIESPLLKVAARGATLRWLGPDLLFICVLGFTALVSYILYLVIEKPLLLALNNKLRIGLPREWLGLIRHPSTRPL